MEALRNETFEAFMRMDKKSWESALATAMELLTPDTIEQYLEIGPEQTTLLKAEIEVQTVFARALNQLYEKHRGRPNCSDPSVLMLVAEFFLLVDEKLKLRYQTKRRAQLMKGHLTPKSADTKSAPETAVSLLQFRAHGSTRAIGHELLATGLWRVLSYIANLDVTYDRASALGIQRTEKLTNALHSLARSSLDSDAEYAEAIEFVEHVSNGKINACGRLGSNASALHDAVTYENVAFMRELLKRYPSLVFERDSNDRTPLLQLFYQARRRGVNAQNRTMALVLLENGASLAARDKYNNTVKTLCDEARGELLDMARMVGRKSRLHHARRMINHVYRKERAYAIAGKSTVHPENGEAQVVSKSRGTPTMTMNMSYAWEYAVKENHEQDKLDLLKERKAMLAESDAEKDAEAQKASQKTDAAETSSAAEDKPAGTDASAADALVEEQERRQNREDDVDLQYNTYETPDEMHVDYKLVNAVNTPVQVRSSIICMDMEPHQSSVFRLAFSSNSGRHLPPSRLMVHFTLDSALSTADEQTSLVPCNRDSDAEVSTNESSLDCDTIDAVTIVATETPDRTPEEELNKEEKALDGVNIQIDWASCVLAQSLYQNVIESDPTTGDASVRTIVEPLNNADDAEFEYYNNRELDVLDMGQFQRSFVSDEYNRKYVIDFMFEATVEPFKAEVQNTEENIRRYLYEKVKPTLAAKALAEAEESGRGADLPEGLEEGSYEAMMHLIGEEMKNVDDAFEQSAGVSNKTMAHVWQFRPMLDIVVAVRRIA